MEFNLLLTASEDSGLSVPAMTIIALLLLMLPFLIKRYTGKSVTEWVRLSVIVDGIQSIADKARFKLFGKTPPGEDAKTFADRSVKKPAAVSPEKSRSAGAVQNEYLRFIAEAVNFGRRNKLFTIVPGNLRCGEEEADLTMIIVTHARVIGVMAIPSGGEITCTKNGSSWKQTAGGVTENIGDLSSRHSLQHELVSNTLRKEGMGRIVYETAMVFTGRDTTLTGARPECAFTGKQFFESLQTQADLQSGSLDPKQTGMKINQLRRKKTNQEAGNV